MTYTRLEFNDSIATLTIDRPKQLNAINSEVLRELQEHQSALESIFTGPNPFEKVRLLLVRGAGEKAFVAGADINELAQCSGEESASLIALGQAVMNRFAELPLLVIAAVDGFALGGGCELALACDLIVSSSKSVFGLPEVQLGLIPGFGGTQRLCERVGIGRAKRMIFSGERVSADSALAIGLCDYVFQHEEFEAKLAELVSEVRLRAPRALAGAKFAINGFSAGHRDLGLCREAGLFSDVRKSQDAQRGLEGFMANTKVEFSGK